MNDVTIRDGRPDELVAVMRVLDAGLLEMGASAVRDRLDAGDCLVADAEGRVVGALVLDGEFVEAVAVSRSRRNRGVGTALVEAALARRGRLVAAFDAAVRPFYDSLGFDVEPAERSDGDDTRLRGVLDEDRA